MLSLDPLGPDSFMLDGVRAYLRVDDAVDDPSLSAAAQAAIGHAENFTRAVIIRRTAREIIGASPRWQILEVAPVQSVIGVTGIPAEGATFALAPDAWEAKIGSRGEVYVRIIRPGIAGRAEIACVAGIAPDWAALPAALRYALLRLTAHFYTHRDAPDASGPPAAALALLRPWRRMSLS